MSISPFVTKAPWTRLADLTPDRFFERETAYTTKVQSVPFYGILNNPVYGGRYYSLRETAIIPVQRRKVDSYRSSAQPLPFDAWHWLEDFPVMSPVVTWDEWETVRRRLAQNKTDAARNAKRTYWLRGMVFCSEDGRRLVGHFRRGIYRYECSGKRGKIGVPKCRCPNLPGPELEGQVWTEVADFLGNPDIFQAEMDRRVHGQEGQGAEAEREIAKLNRRLADVDHRETELVVLRLRDSVSEVALDRNAALLRVERTHLTEELERQRETMSTLEQGQAAVASLKTLREHMYHRLDSATPEDRRTVLEALETRVTVGVGGLLEVSIGIPQGVADCVQRTQGQWTQSDYRFGFAVHR